MKLWHVEVLIFHRPTKRHFKGRFIVQASEWTQARPIFEEFYDLSACDLLTFDATEHQRQVFMLQAFIECDPPKEPGETQAIDTRKT